jgi:hypothetical protein
MHMSIRMFRFTDMIRGSMTAREIKNRYPATRAAFESFGFRDVCDDCAVEVLARRQGLNPDDVVGALNQCAFPVQETEE